MTVLRVKWLGRHVPYDEGIGGGNDDVSVVGDEAGGIRHRNVATG